MAVRAAAGAICSPGGRGSRSPESRRGVHSTPRFAAGADVREVVLYNVLRAAPGNHECAGGTVLREVEPARADEAQHKALQVRPALVREKRGLLFLLGQSGGSQLALPFAEPRQRVHELVQVPVIGAVHELDVVFLARFTNDFRPAEHFLHVLPTAHLPVA